jgi:iron complex outermembrane recepter protein
MIFTHKPIVSSLAQLGLVSVLLQVSVVNAQQATIAPPTQKVERIEVTGSNIKRVDTETSAPIQIITSEEIKRSGKSTVVELLRSLPINQGGGLNDLTAQSSFSSGASSISLRGLGSTATLVLLNGRRIAPYGLSDPNFGQSAVVNLDSLPLDVIDRVEILKDGASAIYGSEAVAGVVNIILRRDFTGAQIGGSFSINRDSEYLVKRAATTLGVGDLAQDRYNVFINYERLERSVVKFLDVDNYLNRDILVNSLYATGRRFSSSYAGNYLTAVFNPTTLAGSTYIAFRGSAGDCASRGERYRLVGTTCRFDLPVEQQIVPKSNRDNLFARGSIDFTANLSGFAEAGFNRTVTTYDSGSPELYGDYGAWFSSTLGRVVSVPEVLPVGHPNNPFATPIGYRHRFSEIGNIGRKVTAEAARGVAGLKGTFASWDWESALLYSKNETEVQKYNAVRASVLRWGILTGAYNFLNPNAGTIKPDELRINPRDVATSSFTILDLKGSTELAALQAGSLGLAVGVEYRKEDRDARPDQATLDGEVLGAGAAAASGNRNVKSIFAELNVPIFKTLEAQVAARLDQYSDYGRSTTPKLGIKWKATPTLALRSSYAEGYRAPSLTEIAPSSVSAFTNVLDPKLCLTGEEVACQTGIGILIQSNPNLKPETAKSFTAGFVWDINQSTGLTIDFWDIKRKNEINIFDLDKILTNEDSNLPFYKGRVVRGVPPTPGGIGSIQSIAVPFDNLSGTKTRGVDIDLVLKNNLGAWGKLESRVAGTYTMSNKQALSEGEPYIEYIGYRNVPRTRASIGTSWSYRDYVVGATGNYIGGFRVAGEPSETCAQASFLGASGICKVGAQSTLAMNFQYTGVKNLTLGLVVRNILDKRPPLNPSARPVSFYWNEFQSIYYSMSAVYKFK